MVQTAALKSSNIGVQRPDVIESASDPFDLSISDEVFHLFSNLVYRTSGIKLGLSKKGLLVSRLAKRLKAHGIRRFHDYYKRYKTAKKN